MVSARLYVIAASAEISGHGTTGMAKFWRDQLSSFLATRGKTKTAG